MFVCFSIWGLPHAIMMSTKIITWFSTSINLHLPKLLGTWKHPKFSIHSTVESVVQEVWGSYHRHPRPSPDSVALGGFQKGDPEPDPSSEATTTRQDNVENGWVWHGKMGGVIVGMMICESTFSDILWPNFTSASAYCYLDWFEIPLQFHELHKPNPVPNCALSRHLSQTETKLCAHPQISHSLFCVHHQTHHQTLWFPCRHFHSKDLNLHLMGISPCRTVDPIHATFHLQVQPQLVQPGCTQPQSSISIPAIAAIWRWILRCCLPFTTWGRCWSNLTSRSSHVLSWLDGRKGAQLHTCRRSAKPAILLQASWGLVEPLCMYVIGYYMNMYIFIHKI